MTPKALRTALLRARQEAERRPATELGVAITRLVAELRERDQTLARLTQHFHENSTLTREQWTQLSTGNPLGDVIETR